MAEKAETRDDAVEATTRELERLRLRASPSRGRGRGRGRGHRRRPSVSASSRRPWPGPPKQSAFVFLFLGERLYAVRNTAGRLGAPGGKREDGDESIFEAAAREFLEETGAALPTGTYAHFEWGTDHHSISVFYRNLTPAEAEALPVGKTVDGDTSKGSAEKEIETLWEDWDVKVRGFYRPHIAQALEIYEAMVVAAQRYSDESF